jgi:hypothetical protein
MPILLCQSNCDQVIKEAAILEILNVDSATCDGGPA